jgi:hypothetical protein
MAHSEETAEGASRTPLQPCRLPQSQGTAPEQAEGMGPHDGHPADAAGLLPRLLLQAQQAARRRARAVG